MNYTAVVYTFRRKLQLFIVAGAGVYCITHTRNQGHFVYDSELVSLLISVWLCDIIYLIGTRTDWQ